MMGGDWGAGMWLGGIGMWLIWILLILGIVALVLWLRKDSRNEVSKSAIDILEERYARGEIDRVDYEQKHRDLGGH